MGFPGSVHPCNSPHRCPLFTLVCPVSTILIGPR